jgi:hypothetical protein
VGTGGRATVTVLADGRAFQARVPLDTAREAEHYRHGGIMPFVLRKLLATAEEARAPGSTASGAATSGRESGSWAAG